MATLNKRNIRIITSLPGILGIAVLSVLFWSLILSLDFPYIDDAFMYVRYANNIIAGHGFSWNPDGEHTFGLVCIPYIYLLAFIKTLFPLISDEKLLLIPAGIFGWLSLPLISLMIVTAARHKALKNFIWLWLVLLLLMLLNHGFLYHLQTGMDTLFSFFTNVLLIGSLILLWKNPAPKFALLSAFCCYLSFFARPDNGLYATVFPTLFLVLIIRPPKKIWIMFFAFLGIFFTADTALKYWQFHDIFPIPYYSKKNGYYEGYLGSADWNPMSYLFNFFSYSLPFLTLIVLGFKKLSRRLVFVFLFPVYCTLMYFFGVEQMMGNNARYYFPSLPFLIVPGVLLLDQLLTGYVFSKHYLMNLTLRTLLILAGVFFLLHFRNSLEDSFKTKVLSNQRNYFFEKEFYTNETLPFSHYWWDGMLGVTELCKKLPPGTLIAASEHGYLGAKNPNIRILDLIGLHDPYLAKNGFSMKYVNSQKPDLIWLPFHTFTKINYDIITDSTFRARYLFLPNVYNYGIAVSKTNRKVYDEVMKELRLLYGVEDIERFAAHYHVAGNQ